MNLEGFDAYRKSVQLVTEVVGACERLPRGYGWLADQARRAVGSVALNVAEGYGRPSAGDRKKHYGYAIGSAHEVAACAELLQRFGQLSQRRFREMWSACDEISRMLGACIRRGSS